MNNVMIPKDEQSAQDLEFMDQAIVMAEEAFSVSEIPVGCVFVYDDQIIARGRNRTNEQRNGTSHAEYDALRTILPSLKTQTALDMTQVTLYVTVEPCIMCASALRQVGIGRVVYGCSNDKFGGTGGVADIHNDPRLIYAPPYEAVGGYRREEAIMLLRRFYISENTAAPNPKKKSNRVLKHVIDEIPTPTSRTQSPAGSDSGAR
ncbi:BZ3500_MvSof-1268-A1-R1_Chr7-1g09113 [Microbotryum saponariae]|uniref:tRNA(adenine(34)) deaminase n=1 Tax=Microbotryum saponariae TaxID=289078 RepID=A0A2X0NCQ3_9BASI|nr:BZ3501_MvSof-1269-A2-R1_Chr7-1g08818 [Microbotryum saponariae]SDA02827.1 BZ3500_MvSof-1268-A1-R1_Chr7-1g09113 [Microbotryum saponariae]